MSSPFQCELSEPHEGHEWSKSFINSDDLPERDYFFCWGVKPSPRFADFRRELEAALATAERWRQALIEEAKVNYRTQDEFYGGDGAVSCESCGGWCRWEEELGAWLCEDCGDDWSEGDSDERNKYRAPTKPDEVDPICDSCGAKTSDHEPVVVDGDDNDYETYKCPTKENQS